MVICNIGARQCGPVPCLIEAMIAHRLVVLLLVCLLSACASTAQRGEPVPEPLPLILISIDGFRADYLDRALTPTLSALAADGARAEWMRPSFPSLTFPNHYTLITGLRPDRNGIVSNTMEDSRIPAQRFAAANRDAIENPRWWEGAVPLWTTAQRHGLRAATMFWPGSEAPVHGAHPDYWARFNADISESARVETVLGWLDLPEKERPSLITLYFDSIDAIGHRYGPDSAEVNAGLKAVDENIARLLAGLDHRGLRERANLVIVSDHGMTATSPDRVVYLDDIVPAGMAHVVMWGVLTGIVPKREHRDEVERVLLRPHAHMQCMRKGDVPERLHYGRNARIPPLLCIAEHGWIIFDRAMVARKRHFSLGEHGYDIDHPDMRSLFIASGPAFRTGVVLAPFDNVDVYPLLAKLLGVRAEPNDGDITSTRAALRQQ